MLPPVLVFAPIFTVCRLATATLIRSYTYKRRSGSFRIDPCSSGDNSWAKSAESNVVNNVTSNCFYSSTTCHIVRNLYILEGSTVTSEMGCPLSVTELKSTRLERRQLGHRRAKCMIISLKRGSLLDAGFEKLGHYIHENQTRVSFDLAMYKSKARILPISKHRFDSVNSLHSSR
ncbi:hypothetical protein Gotur_031329 [Gossypium turneri]